MPAGPGAPIVDGVKPSTRALAADAAGAVTLTVIALFGQREAAHHQHTPRALDLAGYLLVALACLAVAGRRRAPVATTALVGLTVAAYLGAGYAYGPVLFPLALATFSAAARLPMARSLPVCAGALVAVAAGLGVRLARSSQGDALEILTASVWLAVPWSVGTVVRLRAEAAVRGRREEADRAVTEERLRIAAEVHDIAGHGLSVIAMQAGVALHVLERRPEQARVALEEIRAASIESLDGLRAALADVRSPGNAPTEPGAPGLGQLEALLGRIRSAGLAVSLDVTATPVPLTPEAEHAAYRIAQESLTNVLRHAGAGRASVVVGTEEGSLTLTVSDDGTRPPNGPGGGIEGMRARAAAVGGTLRAGPRPGGGFEVSARLPGRMAG
jgi:signal transduction histidine kinase